MGIYTYTFDFHTFISITFRSSMKLFFGAYWHFWANFLFLHFQKSHFWKCMGKCPLPSYMRIACRQIYYHIYTCELWIDLCVIFFSSKKKIGKKEESCYLLTNPILNSKECMCGSKSMYIGIYLLFWKISLQFATHLHFFGQWESNGALFCLLKSRQLATLCRSLCHKNSFDPLWKNCGLLLCVCTEQKCTTVASTCMCI